MRHRLMIAAAIALGVTVVAFAMPDPAMASSGYAQLAIVAALATLRKDHADVLARAAAKIAELKDGLKPDEIRAIEDEHKKLVDQAADLARQIAEAEAGERSQQQRD